MAKEYLIKGTGELAGASLADLDSLSDVALGTPAAGQVLTYVATDWQAVTQDLEDHGDVTITSPETGHWVGYNGSGWVNRTINDETEELSPTSDDFVLVYENTIGAHRKVALSNLPTGSTAYADESGALIVDVRNNSGATITAATPVYVTGFDVGSGYPTIDDADAASSATMPAAGLVKADIANNANGQIVVSGKITGLATDTYSVGDSLYIANGGGLTATRPTGAADEIQKVGSVLRSHASAGVINVSGANRSNDVPNITNGKVWMGNGSNVATETDVYTEAEVDALVNGVTLNNQTGTSYTGVLSDAGKLITMNNAAANTFTIPANASVAYPIGTVIRIMQIGAGQTTVAITTDTLNKNATFTAHLAGQYSEGVVTKITSTSWVLTGDLEAA